MRKLGIIIFFMLTAPMATVAADEFLYWGVMVGQAQVKGQDPLGANFNYDPTNYAGRLGVELGRILSLEVRAMRSNKDEDAAIAAMGAVSRQKKITPNLRILNSIVIL